MLDPRPRDFTAGPALDRGRILDAIRNGRAGTAMQPFSGLMTAAEMVDVADFVAAAFVACAAPNTAYHTAANGWPGHAERYEPAYPFATGELPVDAAPETLAPEQRAGLALFRSACISCHEGRVAVAAPLTLTASLGDADSGLWRGRVREHDPYGTATLHDRSPEIPDLTPTEAEGRRLYLLACAECHAADGTGQNWVGQFLDRSPPDFTDPAFEGRMDSDRFAAMTLTPRPGTAMPDFSSALSPAEARMIADYVRRAFGAR